MAAIKVVRKESQLLFLYCSKFICLLGVVTYVDVFIDEVLLDDLTIDEKGWLIVMLPLRNSFSQGDFVHQVSDLG